MWVIVGSYGEGEAPGGLTVLRFDCESGGLARVGDGGTSIQAGYVIYSPGTGTVYCVDERKTDGRGPVGPHAAVHTFSFDHDSGRLSWQGKHRAPGPFPTFLDLNDEKRLLVSASHGSFEHVEHVAQGPDGEWHVEYVYDHSTVVVYRLDPSGAIAAISDLRVLQGHGKDPNSSPQAGGHCQSSAHAHCATIDPSGRYVIVCDKGTDNVLVFRLEEKLDLVSRYAFPAESAPRHVAFTPGGRRMYLTLELSSELASMDFDPSTGQLTLLDRVRTTATDYRGLNEPAEVRLHPGGQFVYVNNRGEDSLAWFAAYADGTLRREGSADLAKSIHPGLAARSFAFDVSGKYILLADRPANLVRVFALDVVSGRPTQVSEISLTAPAFVAPVSRQ